MPRLVRVDWTPSQDELALKDWDHSYIERGDLRGLKVPDMEDADLFDCALQGTVFGNTALTQIRVSDPTKRLLALDGATVPVDASSYNHHLVAEGMRQCTNADHPAVIFIRDYVLADYSHSWHDALYEAMRALGMKPDELQKVLEEAFAGHPKWLTRLAHHFDLKSFGPSVPWKTDLSAIEIMGRTKERVIDFRSLVSGRDRYKLARDLESVTLQDSEIDRIHFWCAQSDPYYVLFHADRRNWRDGDVPDLPEGIRNG